MINHLLRIATPLFFLLCSWMSFADMTLTYNDAVNRVLAQSPELRINYSEIEETTGQKTQAGVYPNPIVEYSAENVLGNNKWKGWESAESRYTLSQLFELGGQRDHRLSIAQCRIYAAQAGYEASKLDLLNRLMKRFVGAVAAQEELKIAEEQMKIAEEVLQSVSAKVESGKVSLIQQNKAEMALSDAENNLEMAAVDLESAKEKLALLWGDSCLDFQNVSYPFFEVEAPGDLAQSLQQVKDNPELIQYQFEHLGSCQRLKLEKSNAIPNVVVTVGYKTIQDTGDKGVILGAALPLPLFDRNQGEVYKARAQIDKSQEESQQIQRILENKVSLVHKELFRAYQEVTRLKTRVLDSAIRTFELAKEGYLEGEFEYLEMLDSQRTLFEVKDRYIQALLNYHQRRADLEYLTSRVD